jgi:hypothetical protein
MASYARYFRVEGEGKGKDDEGQVEIDEKFSGKHRKITRGRKSLGKMIEKM